jgi:hypothetical protein
MLILGLGWLSWLSVPGCLCSRDSIRMYFLQRILGNSCLVLTPGTGLFGSVAVLAASCLSLGVGLPGSLVISSSSRYWPKAHDSFDGPVWVKLFPIINPQFLYLIHARIMRILCLRKPELWLLCMMPLKFLETCKPKGQIPPPMTSCFSLGFSPYFRGWLMPTENLRIWGLNPTPHYFLFFL